MNISGFLETRRRNLKFQTHAEHYIELGGEASIKISERQFRKISTDKSPPTAQLLSVLFDKTPQQDKNTLIIAFMKSLLAAKSSVASLNILDYLERNLTPPIDDKTQSLWEKRKKWMMYSNEQMSFLMENEEAFRLQKRILLIDNVPIKNCKLTDEKIKKMKDLDLIHIEKGLIKPSRSAYRIPNDRNSGSKATAYGSEFIIHHINTFVSKEGDDHQELAATSALLSKQAVERVLEQLRAFKKWVQSLAQSEYTKETIPVVFVGFAKALKIGKDI